MNNEHTDTHTPVNEASGNNTSNNESFNEMETPEIVCTSNVLLQAQAGGGSNLPKYKVLIIDGMALVNAIPKTDQIKTCNDFAKIFLDQLSNMANNYDEVRLVFDRYLDKSFEEQMRGKRT